MLTLCHACRRSRHENVIMMSHKFDWILAQSAKADFKGLRSMLALMRSQMFSFRFALIFHTLLSQIILLAEVIDGTQSTSLRVTVFNDTKQSNGWVIRF